MRWALIRDSGKVVLTLVLTRKEADAVCRDLKTGDDSPQASKDTWRAFQQASDGLWAMYTYIGD